MRIRAVAGGEFVSFRSGAFIEALVSYAHCAIPAGRQSPTHFAVAHVLREVGNDVVIHLEMLHLSPRVPVTRAPLDVQPIASGGQAARLGFSRKEKRILAIQVGTVIGGAAHTKALANGVADASGPVAILVAFKNSAPIGGRRIYELCARIE